jgi:hypothetical protein
MPCLNEEETIAQCIAMAHVGIQRSGVRGGVAHEPVFDSGEI